MPEALLDKEEAAKVLNLSKGTISNLLARGELPYIKIGRSVRIKREDIEAYIEGQRTIRAK